MKNTFLILLFTYAFGSMPCYSQKKEIIAGIYQGGICLEGAICGTWVLKSDSSFIFLDLQENLLKYVGQGKWMSVNDTVINFYFNNDQIPILQRSEINYFSKTVRSYDSIYISGELKNQEDIGVPYASIVIDEKHVTVSDSTGILNSRCREWHEIRIN